MYLHIYIYIYIHIYVLDISWDSLYSLFCKILFCSSLPVILVSFEFINVSIIGSFWLLVGNVLKIQLTKTYEKELSKTSIFRRVARCKKFVKGLPAF